MAGRDRAPGARCRSGHRPCGPGSMGDGNGVGQIHSRAAAQEDVMSRIKGSAVILASAIVVGHVLVDVPVYAQSPAPQAPAPRPSVVVPQGSPPPPRPAQPAG